MSQLVCLVSNASRPILTMVVKLVDDQVNYRGCDCASVFREFLLSSSKCDAILTLARCLISMRPQVR